MDFFEFIDYSELLQSLTLIRNGLDAEGIFQDFNMQENVKLNQIISGETYFSPAPRMVL